MSREYTGRVAGERVAFNETSSLRGYLVTSKPSTSLMLWSLDHDRPVVARKAAVVWDNPSQVWLGPVPPLLPPTPPARYAACTWRRDGDQWQAVCPTCGTVTLTAECGNARPDFTPEHMHTEP